MEQWSAERLETHVRGRLGPRALVEENGQTHWIRLGSGVVTALDPVLRASGGLWVAPGSGPADRKVADADGKVLVPPDSPRYTLKRVWLTPATAIPVNPYDVETFAHRIRQACSMPPAERARQMARLRERLLEQNIYRWAAEMLDALLDLPEGKRG